MTSTLTTSHLYHADIIEGVLAMKVSWSFLLLTAVLVLPLNLGCGSGPNLPPEDEAAEAAAADEEAAQMAAEEAEAAKAAP